MRSTRVPGLSRIKKLVDTANLQVAMNDADPIRPNTLIITSEMTSSAFARKYLLSHLRVGNTEIVRISTPMDEELSEDDMNRFMQIIVSSRVWGLNMGEFKASERAWSCFASLLPQTLVGFVWINERGKDIGGGNGHVHDWLLGVSQYAGRGILRGKNSILSKNRMKFAPWDALRRPWFDGSNPTLKTELSKKFLFNPCNSIHFQKQSNKTS